MRKKINNQYQARQSFWLSAVNYYILSISIAIAVFFIVWGILHGADENLPWITAGVISSLILISSVILREFVLRKNHQKMIVAQKRLDSNIKNVYKVRNSHQYNRLTLERNTQILKEIEQKSKTAKSLSQASNSHLEVFEICEAYLQKSTRELEGILKGSPRFAALTKGQKRVKALHRFHLLSWASIESQFYIKNSKVQSSLNEKVESSNRALEVLNSAIQFYSDEQVLIESKEVVEDFIVSTKVSHWVELAERATFKENYQRAINHYRDALFFLARENKRTSDHEIMAEKINLEIEKIRNKIN